MIILKNPKGKYLVAHKSNAPDDDWYFPGGGIKKGESVEDALFREVYEELGLNKQNIKQNIISDISHKYDWGEELRISTGFVGQEQKIAICDTEDCPVDLTITNELDNIKWVKFDELFFIIPHEDLKQTLRKLQEAHKLD